MKVCPYCNGIVEEKNAIKCNICGQNIQNEPEYSEEELNDDLILEEIENNNHKRRNAKKMKHSLVIALVTVFTLGLLGFILLYEPKGHIYIPNNTYLAQVGEIVEIDIVYSKNIKPKNVRLEIVSTTAKVNEITFRYQITDNKIKIETIKEDSLVLKFYTRDDGSQKDYNNIVYIEIVTTTSN